MSVAVSDPSVEGHGDSTCRDQVVDDEPELSKQAALCRQAEAERTNLREKVVPALQACMECVLGGRPCAEPGDGGPEVLHKSGVDGRRLSLPFAEHQETTSLDVG